MSGYSPFGGKSAGPARLKLVEVAWRMRAPSGRILECGVYLTDFGFEARMGYGETLLASHRAQDVETAGAHARSFHDDASQNPRFVDLPIGSKP